MAGDTMLEKVKSFLAPPDFKDDEERTRASSVLYVLLWSFMLMLAGVALVGLVVFVEKLLSLEFILVFLTPAMVAYLFLQRSQVRIASLIFVSALWVSLTVFIVVSGGMRTASASFYLVGAVFTGLLLGTRAAAVFAVSSSLAGLAMLMLESLGYPLPRIFPAPARAGWLNVTAGLILVTVALSLTLNSIKEALSSAREQLTERQQAEQALQRRTGELEALRQMALELTAQLDIDTLLHSIVSRAVELLGGTLGGLSLYRPEEQRLERGLVIGAGTDLAGTEVNRGEGLVGKVWQTGEPLVVEDYQTWEGQLTAFDDQGIHAMVGVPVQWGESFLGVLHVVTDAPGVFSASDAELLSLLATQAAIAIQNARLFRETQQQLAELSLLFETSAAVSTSLDLETVLVATARRITSSLGIEGCAISAWDQEQDTLVTLLDYARDLDRWEPGAAGEVHRLSDYPSSRRVLTERRPVAIRVGDPDADPAEIAWLETEELKSLLMVPLVVGGEALGYLELMESNDEREFTATEVNLCQTLANQAAAALKNAQLYEETVRRIRELALLNRVIAASAPSQDVELFLTMVCRELAEAFDSPLVSAFLLDPEGSKAMLVVGDQTQDQPLAADRMGRLAGSPAIGELMQKRGVLVVDDAQTDPRLECLNEQLVQREVTFVALVPLIVEGKGVGSLVLGAGKQRSMTVEELGLLQRVADQVSGALARTRLEEMQRRLSTAVEQSVEAVLITDTDGIMLYANPAFERILGYSLEEVIGQKPEILRGVGPANPTYHQMWQTVGSGQVWHGRLEHLSRDSDVHSLDMTITPVRNQAGEIVNYVGTVRDVTHELQLEKQLRQAQRMEALGRLAGGIAHDFNNLLTVSQLNAQLMQRQLHPDDPLHAHVQQIRETGERATRLIKQLLSFSSQDFVESRLVALDDVVSGLTPMLKRIIGEDVELTVAPATNLWLVKADPSQIEQVIVNLAVNARDAMPEGGTLAIELANVSLDEGYVSSHVEAQPGEYVRLQISDTGIGMDDEVQDHIFEPFFTTKEAGKGTGLGLATAFGIIAQGGGHIDVASEVGEGAEFGIYLPRALEAGLPPSPAAVRPVDEELVRGTETVLIVEDEAAVRGQAVQVLESYGYQVMAAACGADALELSRQHEGPIQLLLTDVVMPQMSGLELAERLWSLRPEMHVLYMSGYTPDAIAHRAGFDEGVAVLPKPFSVEQLVHAVRAVLDDGAK